MWEKINKVKDGNNIFTRNPQYNGAYLQAMFDRYKMTAGTANKKAVPKSCIIVETNCY